MPELTHAPGRGGKRRASMVAVRVQRVWGRVHAMSVKRGAGRRPVPPAGAGRRRRVVAGVGGREGRPRAWRAAEDEVCAIGAWR